MDVSMLLFLSGVSVLFGVILTLVLQYYVLLVYFKKNPVVEPPRKLETEEYSLPEALKKELENEGSDKSGSSSMSISLMLQFLFHELRHSDTIKRWLFKKLSLEFDELLTKTTIGKFFETVTIRDMNLGSQFPDIKNISTENVKLDRSEGHIDTLNLCLDIDYSGNFLLSIDAKMKFGKTAYLSIKVKRISGLARLQFTRQPYTHWSFSFYNEPVMELAVESHFQGRQLQSNITNLIVNQIKKAIRRKHTLPNYKIRYKPFFIKMDPGQLDLDDSELLAQGQLEVTCIEVTRLSAPPGIQSVYCTITADSIPWISLYQKGNYAHMILEVTVTKLRQAQLGVSFKQDQGAIIIDYVQPYSPGARSGLKSGDTLLSIEGKNIASVQQISKLIRSLSNSSLSFRIERIVDNYVFKRKFAEKEDIAKLQSSGSAENVDDGELMQIEQDSFVIVENVKAKIGNEGEARKARNVPGFDKFRTPEKVPKMIGSSENVSKLAQTIGNFTLRKRKTSTERAATPIGSCPSTPQHSNTLKYASSTAPSVQFCDKKHSISEVPEIVRTDSESLDAEVLSATVDTYRGQEMCLKSVVSFNSEYLFNLKEGHKYLNVNVWGTGTNENDVLLGYANIPLAHVLYECCSSMLGHYTKRYSFLPPNNTIPNSQSHPLVTHSGFEHVFCYGDILLSFVWTHDEPLEIKPKPAVTTEISEKNVPAFVEKHDFVRKQFNRTTHCDFCAKKIWLKDAVQCKECGLCCHKKCITKCQLLTECVPADKSTFTADSADMLQSETATNEMCDDITVEQSTGVLKRVNSANNLTIPGMHISTTQSHSLPPSPQRTPSRKQSLVSFNPFTLCPDFLNQVHGRPSEAADCISRLVEHVMNCAPDESLMDAAKETGQQLYVDVAHEEKVEKINMMVGELKKALDAVTLEHIELTKQMSLEVCEVEKAKIAFLMGQTDAKVHALSVLMLHYCSGLQQTQEKIV